MKQLSEIVEEELKNINDKPVSDTEMFALKMNYKSLVNQGRIPRQYMSHLKQNICYDRLMCAEIGIDYNHLPQDDIKLLNGFVLRVISRTPYKKLDNLINYF